MSMTRARAKTEFTRQLDELQEMLKWEWIDKSLPADWNALDHWHPVEPAKERVTIRLDADMVRWFRKMGPGYGRRINMVLRVYWTALLSGAIKSHYGTDEMPQVMLHAHELMRQREAEAGRRPQDPPGT